MGVCRDIGNKQGAQVAGRWRHLLYQAFFWHGVACHCSENVFGQFREAMVIATWIDTLKYPHKRGFIF